MNDAPNSLTQTDLGIFLRLGIDAQLLRSAQVQRLSDEEARSSFGFRFSGDLAGVVFPYFSPRTGQRVTARLRRDTPELGSDGKPLNKYLCPYGDRKHLYFAPGAQQSLTTKSIAVIIVEAEKSA